MILYICLTLCQYYIMGSNLNRQFYVSAINVRNIRYTMFMLYIRSHACILSGGGGGGTRGPDPLKTHKIIGFHSNSGPDPL